MLRVIFVKMSALIFQSICFRCFCMNRYSFSTCLHSKHLEKIRMKTSEAANPRTSSNIEQTSPEQISKIMEENRAAFSD